jgi:hypothetical protein
MSQEILNVLTKWPVITASLVIFILAFLMWIFIKSAREGREVAFWPPRIGPRSQNNSSTKSAPTSEDSSGTAADLNLDARTLTAVHGGQPTATGFEDTAKSIPDSTSGKCASTLLTAPPIAGLYVETDSGDRHWFVITTVNWGATVGRLPSCQISLPKERHLSRSHFRIEIEKVLGEEGHTYQFTIVAHSNPTWVNGEKVQHCELAHRDLIQAGYVRMRFYIL